jgi:hypothetical protein
MKEKPMRKLFEETLQCGYKKCCPTVAVFDDGSIELSDDDTETGSVGTIKIRPEAVARLDEILANRKR